MRGKKVFEDLILLSENPSWSINFTKYWNFAMNWGKWQKSIAKQLYWWWEQLFTDICQIEVKILSAEIIPRYKQNFSVNSFLLTFFLLRIFLLTGFNKYKGALTEQQSSCFYQVFTITLQEMVDIHACKGLQRNIKDNRFD